MTAPPLYAVRAVLRSCQRRNESIEATANLIQDLYLHWEDTWRDQWPQPQGANQ